MVFEGQENLDAALDRGKGVVLLNPHAGNIMMMIAALSLGGYFLFIAAFDTSFPAGPFESLMEGVL